MDKILVAEEYRITGESVWASCAQWTLHLCTGGRGDLEPEAGAVLRCRKGDLTAIPPGIRYRITAKREMTAIRLILEEPSFPHAGAFRITDENGSLWVAFHQAVYWSSRGEQGQPVLAALGGFLSACIVALGEAPGLSEPVEQIRKAIDRNHSLTGFSPDQVISTMPFHPDYLRKRFKQEVGSSPLEYLTALRMARARKLLAARGETGYTVAQIARMCGYEDALYFSRVFKKHCGCTPTAFSRNKE